MIQRPADLDFALEALAKHRVSGEVVERNLQRGETPRAEVGRLEDRRHPTAIDQLENPEAPVDHIAGLRVCAQRLTSRPVPPDGSRRTRTARTARRTPPTRRS